MMLKSKFLGDAGWKDLASKNKLKDNGLAKSLEKLKRVGDDDHDDQAKILEEVVRLAAALKKDKAVAAAPAVVKYLGEVQGDADSAQREVAKSRAEQQTEGLLILKFPHVEAKQFPCTTNLVGCHHDRFCFSHTCRAEQQKTSARTSGLGEAEFAASHGRGDARYCVGLAADFAGQ